MHHPILRGALLTRSLGCALAAGALLAGCSGDGVTLTPQHVVPTPTPTQSPSGATPTPTPTTAGSTPTPTPTPTVAAGTFTFNPNPVVVSAQGTDCATTASFSVSETGYSGTFTAASANTSIATVAPTSGVAANFTVTSVTTSNNPGQATTIVVTDQNGHHQSESLVIGTCI